MSADFLPRREADLVYWSAAFRAGITQSPEQFGLSPEQVAQYAAVQESFATVYQLANQPDTRTPTQIQRKKEAKRALQKLSRKLASIVRSTPGVTAAQRRALGLSVENPGGYRPPIGKPKVPPGLRVVSVMGRTVRVRVYDFDVPSRRGKPDGCDGAMFFSAVGERPPADLSDWQFAGQTTKLVHDIRFSADVQPFTKVWIVALWKNPRGQHGDPSAYVFTHILTGLAKAA